jgi:hypothetical protein
MNIDNEPGRRRMKLFIDRQEFLQLIVLSGRFNNSWFPVPYSRGFPLFLPSIFKTTINYVYNSKYQG